MMPKNHCNSARAKALRSIWILLLLFTSSSRSAQIVIAGGDSPDFTAAQAVSGAAIYAKNCAACHGNSLQGSVALSLAGTQFLHRWSDGQHTLGELFALIKERMPKQAPGSLSEREYFDVTSYLLAKNGYQPGDKPMTADSLHTILIAAAAGQSPAADESAEPKPAAFPGPAKITGSASSDRPSDRELLENSDDTWLMYNKAYAGQRYSGLSQINTGNVERLGVVCAFQTGEVSSFEAAPVVYDGVMYIVTAWNTYAIDSTTCKSLWITPYAGSTTAPMNVTRGVALYKGRLFRSTPNGHFISLDAKTGKLLWDVWMCDPDKGYWLSGAPIAFEDKVFMGEAGADWGAAGHIVAFDVETGRHLWTFATIPTGAEVGADTWKKGAEHGGGSFWSTFALLPSEGGAVLLAPIGNPAPDFNAALRPGDNLFTNSVVALNASTGKLLWYVQQVPHDTRDWDTAAAPVIYDDANGRQYMAVVNKGGWLYIYDRRTHRLIARSEISTHVNETAPITTTPIRICPGNVGGAEWNGPAYSPRDRTLVTVSIDWCGMERITETRYFNNTAYFGGTFTFDDQSTARGWIRAFDAYTGKEIWKHQTELPLVGGVTTTAGGLALTGSTSGEFWALDIKTGEILYRFTTGGSIAGAPSTFRSKGRQYIAVPSSGGPAHTPWGGRGAATVFIFAEPEAGAPLSAAH
jgi:alcohol dehydrogenase (cytochrome c)